MSIRVSAGKFKNTKLQVPEESKPLRERVKLAVFSILGDKIFDAKCLDLYAGSGNLGIEALSRGAKSTTFVEINPKANQIIQENIENISQKFDENLNTKFKREDSIKYVTNTAEYYDVVFMDPPYDTHTRHILKYLHETLNDEGILIYFHDKSYILNIPEINPNLKVVDSRTYGITMVDFIAKS